MAEHGPTEGDRPAAGAPPDQAPAYEPPAIAWEEPFEPLAAGSCAVVDPFDPACNPRPLSP